MKLKLKNGGTIKLQPGGSVWSQISNPRQTYTDGYGVERPVNESNAITIGRKVYNAADRFLNGPSKEWYNERGMSKPNASLGVAGWIAPGGYGVSYGVRAINKAQKYHGLGKETQQLIEALNKSGSVPQGRSLSRLQEMFHRLTTEGQTVNKYHLNQLIKHYSTLAEKALEKSRVRGTWVERVLDMPVTQPVTKKSESIQKIVNSDFEPFDEMKTLWETGSKAKTTAGFRLSDWKNGGVLKQK